MDRRRVLAVTGFALSGALLASVLWRLDWNVFVGELRYLRKGWLVSVFACFASGVCLRALRWNVLLGATSRNYRSFWEATSLGLAANQIYPFRAGEVIRILAIQRFLQIPLGSAATSSVVDRLGDVVLLGMAATLLTMGYVQLPHADVVHRVLIVAGSISVLATLVLGMNSGRSGLRAVIRWSARRSGNWLERLEGFYDDSLTTLSGILQPGRATAFAFATAGVFALDCVAFLCASNAFGWDLPWPSFVTLWLFLGVATSLPSAPAYVGVFQVACVLALGLFGINESQAVAYSIILQLNSLLAVLLMAGLALTGRRGGVDVVRDAIGSRN